MIHFINLSNCLIISIITTLNQNSRILYDISVTYRISGFSYDIVALPKICKMEELKLWYKRSKRLTGGIVYMIYAPSTGLLGNMHRKRSVNRQLVSLHHYFLNGKLQRMQKKIAMLFIK